MIAIIGGSGFVGTNLTRLLQASGIKFCVYDIVKPRVDVPYVFFDVTIDGQGNLFKNVSCIINLAAVHRDDVKPIERYFEVNVTGARNVCAIAEQNQIDKVIFFSSVAIYGFAPANTGEDGKVKPFNEYGRTKALAEIEFKAWQSAVPGQRSLVIIRPTVIFGPGNRGNVFNLLRQIALKRFVMIGSGENVKSMAYIDNVVAFTTHSLNAPPGFHLYNYIDKPDLNMNELISTVRYFLFGRQGVGLRLPHIIGLLIGHVFDKLSSITGVVYPVSSIRVKKFTKTTQFSSAAHSAGFVAPCALKDGLMRTLEYEFKEDNSGEPTFETE